MQLRLGAIQCGAEMSLLAAPRNSSRIGRLQSDGVVFRQPNVVLPSEHHAERDNMVHGTVQELFGERLGAQHHR